VSVEDQQRADERIPHLLATPAVVRWVSYEPALGPVNFNAACAHAAQWNLGSGGSWFEKKGRLECAMQMLDWIVIGGESGPGARPFDIAWARSVIRQGRGYVPVFMKQVGRFPNGDGFPDDFDYRKRDRKGASMEEWPEDIRVREYPR
jgi:protein gp37